MTTDVCPAVSIVPNEPVKPVPLMLKMAEPAVAPVMGTVIVPVCPPVPFAVKVPATEAVPQLNAKAEAAGEAL